MAIKCFEDVIAWQKAQDIAVVVYKEFKIITIGILEVKYAELLFPFQITLQKVLIEVPNQNLEDFYISR